MPPNRKCVWRCDLKRAKIFIAWGAAPKVENPKRLQASQLPSWEPAFAHNTTALTRNVIPDVIRISGTRKRKHARMASRNRFHRSIAREMGCDNADQRSTVSLNTPGVVLAQWSFVNSNDTGHTRIVTDLSARPTLQTVQRIPVQEWNSVFGRFFLHAQGLRSEPVRLPAGL